MPSTIRLKPSILTAIKPSKIFKAPTYIQEGCSITSLDFDDKGEMCVTSSDDETIQLFDVRSGRHTKTLNSKKYGVNLVRFTHRSTAVLYASTKTDDTIRYHSLHDNRYMQYFRGHKSRVCSLTMNPLNDSFLSGSVGDAIKLWDLRTPNAQGTMPVQGHPTVAFDPSGEVFALGISERMSVLLYARNQFTAAPFMVIAIEDDVYLSKISMPPRPAIVTSLSFSPASTSGHLLVGTAGDQHYVLDTWNNAYKWRLVGHQGLERVPTSSGIPNVAEAGISGQETCWSPCGSYVFAGGADGSVCVWEIPDKDHPPQPGQDISIWPCAKLEGQTDPVRAVAFSPRQAVLATGGSTCAFWLPMPASQSAASEAKDAESTTAS
ncbi:unnamed protein product [Sympodiomycopsis kandeliae]